jgi:hypothetical protein
VGNRNYIRKEMESSLNSGSTYCHSVHGYNYVRLLFRKVRIKIFRTIILSFVLPLYVYEVKSLALRK